MVLHNRIAAEILKERLANEPFERVTISFYKYADINDPHVFRDELYRNLFALEVFGRIYVAREGINAQLSVPEHALEALSAYLETVPFLKGNLLNIAVEEKNKSFWVLKIKVREKIVADGLDAAQFSVAKNGQYVDAIRFNELAADPDTIIVDMRNHYEYEVGHFERALEVPSDTFKQQLPMAVEMLQDKKDKNIVMYCTGGIRCEKASAWMKRQGFKNVFHLKGGIINYVNKAREKNLPLRFHGKNFVFDERLGERVTDEVISHCHQCGKPCDTHVNCKNEGCHLLFIQCQDCAEKYNSCCSEACKHTLELPEEERKILRKGQQNGQKIFNKSRDRMLGLATQDDL